jgi:hypothetical protein
MNGYDEEDGENDQNNESSINAHQRAKALKVKSGKNKNSDYDGDDATR